MCPSMLLLITRLSHSRKMLEEKGNTTDPWRPVYRPVSGTVSSYQREGTSFANLLTGPLLCLQLTAKDSASLLAREAAGVHALGSVTADPQPNPTRFTLCRSG